MAFLFKQLDSSNIPRPVDSLFYEYNGLYIHTTASIDQQLGFRGQSFIISGYITDLDKDHSFDILIQTGALEIHIVGLSVEVSGLAHGYIYRGTKFSAAGDTIPVHCTNDTQRSTSSATITGGSSETNNMTITDVGTLWIEAGFSADSNRNVINSQTLGSSITLRRSETYLIRIDNNELADDISVTNQMVWIEV